MCDSRPYSRKSPAPGARAMKASGVGFWELDLADGSAWFSDWFCQRLQWTEEMRRPALSDLRPIMSSETWDTLLRHLRSHLEEQSPLDAELQVRLGAGQVEWWHLWGSAQRDDAGHPTHFAGCVRDVTATHPSIKAP
jgi:two-component system, cell cycle sensor histidine kinase PleC